MKLYIMTDLISAATNGDIETVRHLLIKGAKVCQSKHRALRMAAVHGCTDVVKLLIAYGGDHGTLDNYALFRASQAGNRETVQLLLDLDDQVITKLTKKISTDNDDKRKAQNQKKLDAKYLARDRALYYAVEAGRTETARLLIDRAANVHANHILVTRMDYDREFHFRIRNRGLFGQSDALSLAASGSNVELLDLLARSQTNVSSYQNSLNKAYRIAAINGKAENAKILLSHGAKTSVLENYDKSLF